MATLSINIDHVANIRQARLTDEPEPITAAVLVELAGANGITVHLREDRRHIQDRDVELLRKIIQTRLNLEMASTDEMLKIACEIKPDMVTLVPEEREELTTEGGLDILANKQRVSLAIERLKNSGIPVSIFIYPDASQIEAAKELGVDWIEIHTGCYAEAHLREERHKELTKIKNAACHAKEIGIGVHAGHGLTYRNILPVAAIEQIEEFSIGHSVIARAVFVGIVEAVHEMKRLIESAKHLTGQI
jgi:pyridoxine 5-phosphate synthase